MTRERDVLSRRQWLATLGSAIAGAGAFPGLGRLSAATTGPGPRAGHALAYHAGRHAVCLLGGYTGTAPRQELPYFWNGGRWERESSPAGAGPFARTHASAVYASKHDVVLYFGGLTLSTGKPTGELWTLKADGRWETVREGSPGPRDHHQAVYDTERRRMVMYGGQDGQRRWITDTWEFDDKWHGTPTPAGPGPRAQHAMAYDSRRRRTVLFGGLGLDGRYTPDTWEWDGRTWTKVAADGPAPRGQHAMTFDAAHGVTVLFGGDTGLATGNAQALSDETWTWGGVEWVRRAPTSRPSPRALHAMAYDAGRHTVVLFGGGDAATPRADTWEWDGEHWKQAAA
jgi:Kelch motif